MTESDVLLIDPAYPKDQTRFDLSPRWLIIDRPREKADPSGAARQELRKKVYVKAVKPMRAGYKLTPFEILLTDVQDVYGVHQTTASALIAGGTLKARTEMVEAYGKVCQRWVINRGSIVRYVRSRDIKAQIAASKRKAKALYVLTDGEILSPEAEKLLGYTQSGVWHLIVNKKVSARQEYVQRSNGLPRMLWVLDRAEVKAFAMAAHR
jgi:hypothetical protein